MTMTKRLSYLLIAGASAVSLGAVAGGEQKAQQPQAQGAEAQPQASQNQELVKQAQEKLSAAGHEAGPADGMIGPKTRDALKEFQQSKGIEPSGQLDRQTLAELGVSDAASASSGSSAAPGSSGPSSSSEPGAQPQPQGAGSATGETPSDKPSS
jgi:peptidoglycan hydrolase-like protein with peptidoglycan-binding domain